MKRAAHPSEDSLLPAPGRTEAFSDAVLAIAATLLVLEVHAPTTRDVDAAGGLLPALLALWPSYLSYVAAFLTIGAIWVAHHATFRRIAAVDRVVIAWNLVLLMAVSFIPFPTALVGEHLQDGLLSDEARIATAAYALLATGCTIPWVFLWRHLAHHPVLLRHTESAAALRTEVRRAAIGVAAYLAATGLALLLPPAAIAVLLLVPVAYVGTIDGLRIRRVGAS